MNHIRNKIDERRCELLKVWTMSSPTEYYRDQMAFKSHI
jgi:hypothetical protein